jgi:sec-independent protein translocase protein TatA
MGLPNIGPVELIIILVIALLILGPGKLPEVGAAFGRTIREFRKASTDLQESANLTPAPASPGTATPNTITSQSAPNTISTPSSDTPRGTPDDSVEDPS